MGDRYLFDDSFVRKILEIFDFDINKLDVNKISYVHMNDYKFSSFDKPLLLTFNLQCCVAIYLYGNGFGFLAHINTVKSNLSSVFFNFQNNEFLLSDLVLEKLKNYSKYNGKYDEFYIGMVLGSSPYSNDYYIIDSIIEGMNNLVKNASLYGIKVQLNNEINLPDFIMNTITNEFISPNLKIKIR